jgi:hypothetical protein
VRPVTPLASVLGVPPEPSVFIPVLLGAGLAVSLVAGLVERTAAAVHSGPSQGGNRGMVVGVLVAVLAAGGGTAAIWYAAHYRPTVLGDGTTEITVEVATKEAPGESPEQTVEVMGEYCARTAISGVDVERIVPATADTAVLVVSPLLDEEALRRYGGCLEDANLDQHRLTVAGSALVPVTD